MEYDVWGVPPGKEEIVHVASFEEERWQWAEKLAQYLRDKGYTDVSVELDTYDEELEDEDLEEEE